MVFSVRGRQRYWGISQLEGTVLLVVVSNVPVPSSFRNASVVCNVSIAKRDSWRYQMVTCQINKVFQNAATESRSTYIYIYLITYWKCWCCSEFCEEMALMYFFFLCGQHHRRNIWHFICVWLPSLWIVPAQRKSTSDPAITLESFSTARRWKPLQTITVAKWNPRYRQIW